MDFQNTDRRDSKKSTKSSSGGGGSKNVGRNSNNGGGNGNSGNGGSGKSSRDKQRSNSQKSGKPYREIYKPPSMRSSKIRSSNSYSEDRNKHSEDKCNTSGANQTQSKKGPFVKNGNGSGNNIGSRSSPPQQIGNYSGNDGIDSSGLNSQNGYSLFGNGSGSNGNSGNGSVPSSPLVSTRMQQQQQNAFNIGLANQMLNVNAKEFQFLPIQQQQQQQISNFLSQFDPSLFYNTNSPILASSGCYPLKQSKSSGNMNLLLQQQQQAQAAAIQQLQNAMGFGFPLQSGNFSVPNGNDSSRLSNIGSAQFNRLSQSKSSGNVPGSGNKQRVRFDDEEQDFDDEDFVVGPLGNYLASLKLNGDAGGMSLGSKYAQGYPFQTQQQANLSKVTPTSPQPGLKSSLQKSRTGFYLNLYGNHQQQQQQINLSSSSKPIYGFGNSAGNNLHHGSNYSSKVTTSGIIGNNTGGQQQHSSAMSNVVKRSRSFGPGTHHLPRASATMLLSASTHGPSAPAHSVYTDFCITKWPRIVQELVTAAVTGVERIPARNWIEMVNGIFEAMLCDYRSTKKDRNFSNSQSIGITSDSINTTGSNKMTTTDAKTNDGKLTEASVPAAETSESSQRNGVGNIANAAAASSQIRNNDFALSLDMDDNEEDDDDEEEEDDDDDTDLTSAAVHIFLYFIQREKDRTVMESLLNTCFASFQRLSSYSSSSASNKPGKSQQAQHQRMMAQQIGKPSISRQWSNFLRFLSTLYSQVKLIRRQKQNQQQPGQSMDEMSFSLLALLCDSCLATLRSPQSYTAEMMGCLFTVLTSIGRDMEGTFPLKMKQLLAAVRDALLGIGPYQQHHYPNSTNSTKSSSASASRSSGLSPIVQKTLMQLIELHAANWQLPASAVRYYYSSVGSGNNSKSMSSSTTNNSNPPSSVAGSAPAHKNSNGTANEKQNNNSSVFVHSGSNDSPSQKLSLNLRKQNKDMEIMSKNEVDDEVTSEDSSNDKIVEINQLANSAAGTKTTVSPEDG